MKTLVKIKKLSPVENPKFETPESKNYIPGQDNPGVSLPVDYEIEGVLLSPIEVGRAVRVERNKRNGIKAFGFFNTSTVKAIAGNIFTTENSVYIIDYIYPETAK